MKKIFGFVFAVIVATSFAYVPVSFADAGAGKSLFNSKKKKCKTCHKASGSPTKFKPVGPGLKGVGQRLSKEYLQKWLSPAVTEVYEANGPEVQDLKARYKAAKKKDIKKSQMVKNFGPRKGGKPPKIQLTDQERSDIIDYLMTL